MPTMTRFTLLTAALLLAPVVPTMGAAQGAVQQAPADARWQAWVGCWEPAGAVGAAGASALCVLPAGPSTVELVTVADRRVERRERIDASGVPVSSTREACTGTDRAHWSPDGRRLYLRSEHRCDGAEVRSSGVMAMPAFGELIDVRGTSVAGGPPHVGVRRYRELFDVARLPEELVAEVQAAVAARPTMRSAARANATALVTTEAVAEAAREVDAAVVEAWLIENGDGFPLDARRLVALADAGVPARVIDVMVALSYPGRFAIDLRSRDAAPRAPDTTSRTLTPPTIIGSPLYGDTRRQGDCYDLRVRYSAYCDSYRRPGLAPYAYSPYGYSPFGWGGGNWGYGYGAGTGGGGPVIVVRPSDRGRVVKGKGYTRGEPSDDDAAAPRSRTGTSTSGDQATTPSTTRSNEGSRSNTSSGGSQKESSGSSESGRKAKPRNP
jgi:hypothetical protein